MSMDSRVFVPRASSNTAIERLSREFQESGPKGPLFAFQFPCLARWLDAIAVKIADMAKNHKPGFVAAVARPDVLAAKITSATTITSSMDQRANALNQPGIAIAEP